MSDDNSVFHALEDDSALAANLAMRAELMMVLTDYIEAKGWTQLQAADFFSTSQPRMSKLLAGDIEAFRIDGLVKWLHLAGRKVELRIAA